MLINPLKITNNESMKTEKKLHCYKYYYYLYKSL